MPPLSPALLRPTMTLSGSSAVELHPYEQAPDTASELLVAELVLNDIAVAQNARKGKAREGALRSDADIALDLQAASLTTLIDILHDYQFASSIDRAIELDARQLERYNLIERAERDDHRAAVALRDGHDLPRQTLSQLSMERVYRPARESPRSHRGHTRNTAGVDLEVVNTGMKNVHVSQIPSRHIPGKSSDVDAGPECVICRDGVITSRAFKAPGCGHYYCRGCIINLVETSLHDEGLYPLRCCHQPLPLASGVFKFISTSLRSQFLAKGREYAVPAGSRVYCSYPRCSAFLDASGDAKRDFVCDECYTVTCSQCKQNVHPGEDCVEHQSVLELREMAIANEWQTCPGCHAIVELSQGCYHITCRCSTQFCYLCSARWRTCDCRQWDEERLVDDAERRVRNEFGDWEAEAQPAQYTERVYRRMEALRENHECQGHLWRYRHGCGRCEECGDFLPVFLMRCGNCQAVVCRRCSVNRL